MHRVVLSGSLGFPRVLKKHPESEFDLSIALVFRCHWTSTQRDMAGQCRAKAHILKAMADLLPNRFICIYLSDPDLDQTIFEPSYASPKQRSRASGRAGKLDRHPFGTFLCVPNGRSGMPQGRGVRQGSQA